MMLTAAALAALSIALLGPGAWALGRARWVLREPRAALVLWQSIGLVSGVAAVGAVLAAGLAPLGPTFPDAAARWASGAADGNVRAELGLLNVAVSVAGVALFGWLVAALAVSAWRTARSRWRHRAVLDLVSTPLAAASRPSSPLRSAARVLDHPGVAAYCLPGLVVGGSRVVLTSGTVALLDDEELDAVLAHERAHLVERHDLVVLPFAAWAWALPFLPAPQMARRAVGALVEMVADDRASGSAGGANPAALATALARFGTVAGAAAPGMPTGAMAAADGTVVVRVRRLIDPPRRSPLARLSAWAGAAALAVSPAAAVLLPLYG